MWDDLTTMEEEEDFAELLLLLRLGKGKKFSPFRAISGKLLFLTVLQHPQTERLLCSSAPDYSATNRLVAVYYFVEGDHKRCASRGRTNEREGTRRQAAVDKCDKQKQRNRAILGEYFLPLCVFVCIRAALTTRGAVENKRKQTFPAIN